MAWTDVSHYEGLTWWGPFSDQRILDVLKRIDLPSDLPVGARVLDVGCGSGALLAHFAERGGRVTGIDRSAAALDLARERLAECAPQATSDLLEVEMSDYEAAPASFELISNLGGPFVKDEYAATLRAYAKWLAPSGLLLSGHGFWMQPPPPEYLAATGLPEDALADHATNIATAQASGFELLYESNCTGEEFDHFEDTLLANREAHAATYPNDAEFQANLAKKRAWHDAQNRWGRDTMGFALYLYRLRV